MTKLNPKIQLAKHRLYPLAFVHGLSYGDAAKLNQLHTLLSRTYDALALAGGYDPANLTEEDREDIREVLNFGEDKGNPDDNIHLERWHELHRQIYAIQIKYQTQSIAIARGVKGVGNV